MNKRDALALLANNLEEYLQQGFKELLHGASGNEKEIFVLLIKQLNFVKELRSHVYNADGNEIIKYLERDYYSLHLSGKNFNLRLLMAFGAGGDPIFLAAFYERGGKRASDYTQWKKVLANRYADMES